MSKCTVKVELDEPDRIYAGGDTVRGTVLIDVDSKFKPKKLTIESAWETHGRGNKTSDTSEEVTEFPDEWISGKQYRYPFELKASRWPPTYHGTYLNVDHVIRARVHIAWAFDPKASAMFRVYAIDGPDAADPEAESSCIGKVVGGIFIFVLIMMLINPLLWIVGVVVGIGVAFCWFFFTYLPKLKLGPVEFHLDKETYTPGETLSGHISFTPRSRISINDITLELTARESCVSGSGSNKTTHSHVELQEKYTLMDECELKPNEPVNIPITIELPAKPIFTLSLPDNSVTWSCNVRINIPKWPDWKQNKTLTVRPPALEPNMADNMPIEKKAATAQPAIVNDFQDESGVSFRETVQLIFQLQSDPEQIQEIVQAVAGLEMRAEALIDGRIVYEGDEPLGHPEGYSIQAHYPDPMLPMLLLIKPDQRDQFSQLQGMPWAGTAKIVGYSERHDRLLVKIG